jgi:hypothetical protein
MAVLLRTFLFAVAGIVGANILQALDAPLVLQALAVVLALERVSQVRSVRL